MGSKSNSTTQKTDVTNNTNKNTSGLNDSQAFTDVGYVNIESVDGAIVEDAFGFGGEAFDFGRNSLSFAGDGLSDILDFGSEIVENQQVQLTDTLSSINAANASSADLSNSGREQTIQTAVKYLAIAGAVIAVALLAKRWVK